VNHDQVGQVFDAEAAHQRADGQPRVVHVRLRERQGQTLAIDPSFGDQRPFPASWAEPLAVATGEQGNDIGAGVVPGTIKLLTRITQSNGQEIGRRARPGLEQALALLGWSSRG
jgi:hypothetical protein